MPVERRLAARFPDHGDPVGDFCVPAQVGKPLLRGVSLGNQADIYGIDVRGIAPVDLCMPAFRAVAGFIVIIRDQRSPQGHDIPWLPFFHEVHDLFIPAHDHKLIQPHPLILRAKIPDAADDRER